MFVLAIALVIMATPVHAEKVKLTYMYWGSTVNDALQREIVAMFMEQNPDIEIECILQAGVRKDYPDKLLVSTASGMAPDLFLVSYAWAGLVVEHNLARPLNDLIERDRINLSDFIPGGFGYSYYNGIYYGIPRASHGTPLAEPIVVYNRRLFDEAGLPYPKSGWTFADVTRMSKQLSKDINGDGQLDQWGANLNRNYYYAAVWSNGAEILTPDNKQFVMNSPAAIEALEWMAELNAISPKAPLLPNDDRVGIGFNSVVSALQQALPTVDWAFAEWPVGPQGKQGISSAGANYIAISPTSKHQEEAWRFIKFLISREVHQFEVFERGANVLLKSVALSPRYLKLDKAPWDMTPVVTCATKPLPLFAKNWDAIQTQIVNAVGSILSGTKAARTAMDEVAEFANFMLNN